MVFIGKFNGDRLRAEGNMGLTEGIEEPFILPGQ
jgi:hypothetical protein